MGVDVVPVPLQGIITRHDDSMTARAALATGAIMAGTVTAHSWAEAGCPPWAGLH